MSLYRMFVSAGVVAALVSVGTAGTLIDEDFSDLNAWNDLSTAITWAGSGSAFTTAGGVVEMTDTAKSNTGWTVGEDLLTFNCLDHQFASPIDRTVSDTVITVNFRAKWSPGALSNEGSRFVVTLTHDYPSGGLDMDKDDKWNDFSDEWWARPAYNMRIRTLQDEAMLMYGGGPATEGEFEHNATHWMPGFSSGPGGHSPQPGTHGVVGAGAGRYSQSEFKDYQYIITPTQQQLWYDGQLVGTQDISDAFDSQGFRQDFAAIAGIRLYWRGSAESQAIIDSLSVDVVPEPASLTLLGLGAALLRRRRGA